jgi:hypothetical protein
MAPRVAPAGVAIIAFAFAGSNASATVTEYTDPTAYDAATSNSTIFTFDGLTPPGSVSLGGVTIGDLSVTGSSFNTSFVVGSDATLYGGTPFFTGFSPTPGIDAAEVLCTLSGSTALGFIYGDFEDAGGSPFTVTLSTGDSFALITPTNPGFDTGFVGFVSNTPITSVTFSDNGLGFDLLQVDKSSPRAAGVPEPSPLALMAIGLLSLALVTRPRTVKVERLRKVPARAMPARR